MKLLTVVLMIVTLSGVAFAQAPAAPNAFYAELLGNGLLYSCNYDRLFSESFGGRIGVSYAFPGHTSLVTLPVMAYYLVGLGSGPSKLEFGLGATILLQPEGQSLSFMAAPDEKLRGTCVVGTATVGFRYQRADGGLIIRVGATPFFGQFSREINPSPFTPEEFEDVFRFQIWGGFSIGYGF
jgi:hypothetical protein